RRRVGPLSIDHALTVAQAEAQAAIGTLPRHLIGLDQVLDQLPVLTLTDDQVRLALHGGAVSPAGMEQLPASTEPVSVRLQNQAGRLLAIGIHDARTAGPIKIRKVLTEIESLD
ncbi:MAG: hypothetical protein HP490_11970, partial [Nitrospira sp.]|nr:hypothetical protein [Nitrospira sp.]